MKSLLAAAVAAALAAGAAQAQIAPHGNGPIDITADNGTLVNATCEATWSGSAEALQGSSRLRANVIRAFLKKKPPAPGGAAPSAGSVQTDCGATQRIEADGDVFYVTPDETARGDHAVYDADSDQIVMTGNVIVVQGKNVVHGDKMTIWVQTRQVQIDSAAKGRGAPGRVRGVFYSNQPGAPGSAPQAAH
ncbi:MAG TPA: LptA/OstA family protein [Caulobacteraceae bacterium]|nr:LptA/OstA family protein [Caulobacteraceae bacterium]